MIFHNHFSKLPIELINNLHGCKTIRVRGEKMSRKTVNPTIKFNQYTKLWYRYMRYICTIKKISMLEAMEQFGYRYRTLYSKKLFLKT